MVAVYWYNMTPKDDTTISTAPANSIHMYQARVKDIDVTPSRKHTNPGIYEVRDAVWIKTPHNQCSTQLKKEMVIGSFSPIPFSSLERLAISETSACDSNLLHRQWYVVGERLKYTAVFQCRAIRFICVTRGNVFCRP